VILGELTTLCPPYTYRKKKAPAASKATKALTVDEERAAWRLLKNVSTVIDEVIAPNRRPNKPLDAILEAAPIF
jgi:hypothetical protein